jgi:hypothetical protein
MAESSIACPYFYHLAEYQVAVCKECQYAVWPDQIEGHLQEEHKIKRKDASNIGLEVRSWPGVVQYPIEFTAPSTIVAPHPQLPVYTDGLLCRLNPSQCQRVLRSIRSMKQYWHEDHQGWSAGKKRGRPSRVKEKRLQAQIEQMPKRMFTPHVSNHQLDTDSWDAKIIVHGPQSTQYGWEWYKMGFIACWNPLGLITLVCFDVQSLFSVNTFDTYSPYAVFSLVLDALLRLYDDSVWSIRNHISQWEAVSRPTMLDSERRKKLTYSREDPTRLTTLFCTKL